MVELLVDAVDGLVVTVCTVSTDHGGVVACHWSVVR